MFRIPLTDVEKIGNAGFSEQLHLDKIQEINLNDDAILLYDEIHDGHWVFENYIKAGRF